MAYRLYLLHQDRKRKIRFYALLDIERIASADQLVMFLESACEKAYWLLDRRETTFIILLDKPYKKLKFKRTTVGFFKVTYHPRHHPLSRSVEINDFALTSREFFVIKEDINLHFRGKKYPELIVYPKIAFDPMKVEIKAFLPSYTPSIGDKYEFYVTKEEEMRGVYHRKEIGEKERWTI